MKLKEIVDMLHLETRTKYDKPDIEVKKGYASDLLSDVIAHSSEGDLWITLQIHHNIVAVASMKEHAGIVIINGRVPDEEIINKAEAENIPIMLSKMPAFELTGKLYSLGITGMKKDVKGV